MCYRLEGVRPSRGTHQLTPSWCQFLWQIEIEMTINQMTNNFSLRWKINYSNSNSNSKILNLLMMKSEVSWPGPKYLENLVVGRGQKKVGKHCPRALRARGFYQFLQKQARFRCKTEGKNLEVNFSKFQGISILTRSCWNHPLPGSSNMGRYAAPTRFHGSMAMAFPSRWFHGYGYLLCISTSFWVLGAPES